MKYLLSAVLMFSQASILFAQSAATNVAPKAEKVRTVKLNAKYYRIKGEPIMRLSGLKVIPMCADTNQLGFVPAGIGDKKMRAVPDKPYVPFLQDYVNEMLKDVYRNPGMQMLWVIKDLRISESTGGTNALVRLKADAYIAPDKQHYRKLQAIDTVLTEANGLHNDNIGHVMQVFYLYCELAAGTYTGDTTLTEAAIIAKEQEKFSTPIYVDNVYKEGVYLSYEEFLANTPSFTDFEITVKKKKVTIFTKAADGSLVEITAPWGLSKKGELYKYDQQLLLPIEKKANGFILSKLVDDTKRSNKLAGWKDLSHGLTDAWFVDVAPKVPVATGLPDQAELKQDATAVDVESGKLVF